MNDNDMRLSENAINAAKAILSDPEFSKSTLHVAQALRSVLSNAYGAYDCFVRRRAEMLVDAAIAYRLGCTMIVYYPSLYWEEQAEQAAH